MSLSLGRRRLLLLAALQGSAIALCGCGTILHPERRGQPGGRLDWKIVALNGLGLLLFFIPGVIAFAVDFSNGTIYLPADDPLADLPTDAQQRLVSIKASSNQPTAGEVEELVSQHTARPISLEPGTYTTRPLKSLAEFWTCHATFRLGAGQ
jgi:hypothetical protein